MALFPLLLGVTADRANAELAEKQAAIAVVKGVLDAWQHRDWAKLYYFLSRRDKERATLKQFITKQRTFEVVERLSSYRIGAVRFDSRNAAVVSIELNMLNGPLTHFFPSKGWTPEKVRVNYHLILNAHHEWRITFEPRGDQTAK